MTVIERLDSRIRRERELLAQSRLSYLSSDDPYGPPCAHCRRPVIHHILEEARECANALIRRESTYCRLTGPRR